ncbi:hypothetical protein QR680_008018 [Steinernema hermaphroditum]|uniref:Poly [ADP-ribose] polymerase n=1 Tax=Steinernema hermaphroditum TaxID=289476 RepID=A0AA39IHH5_9BILA|nr:hypothetical protein QR680_008018 [Steinernema hermaphroditum]
MNSTLYYGFEIQGRGEATKEDIYIGVSMFILALCTIVLGSVNLYFIKKVSIFHNAFGWLWASRTVAEMIVEVNHALYTAPVTIIQPQNVDPSVAYILYFVTFIGAVSGCLLHGLLSVNRCIAVYFPVHYRRIFTKSFCFGYIAAIGVSCLALASIYIVFPCNMIGYSPTVYEYVFVKCDPSMRRNYSIVGTIMNYSCMATCVTTSVVDLSTLIRIVYIRKRQKLGPKDRDFSRDIRFFAQSAFQNVYMLFTAAAIVYANNRYKPDHQLVNLLGFFSLLGAHIVNATALLIFNSEGSLRLSIRTPSSKHDGTIDEWYHCDCFWSNLTNEINETSILGIENLKWKDLKRIRESIREQAGEAPANKVARKYEDRQGSPDKEDEFEKQTEDIWALRELLNVVTQEELQELIEENRCCVPKWGERRAFLDLLVDLVIFGVPENCTTEKCRRTGTIVYSSAARRYVCIGDRSEYTVCNYSSKQPGRSSFEIPDNLQKKYPALKAYHNCPVRQRVYPIFFESQRVVEGPWNAGKKHSSGQRKRRSHVKNGCAVDSAFVGHTQYHVFKENSSAWQATLVRVNVKRNMNSSYKLQLVQHDKTLMFVLFRAWGRTGAAWFGHKVTSYGNDLNAAKAEFRRLFAEKTGNEWDKLSVFKKVPKKMDLIQMETYDEEPAHQQKLVAADSHSTLPAPIKELIAMIFDEDLMKDYVKEMHIDEEKLPLGQLSQETICTAYSILQKLEDESNKDVVEDLSNRFYSMIPHTVFEALSSVDAITRKRELLDNLSNIQAAYTINRRNDGDDVDPIDVRYGTLQTKIEVVDEDSEEFLLISQYSDNTQVTNGYSKCTVEIKDIYKVEREGEKERYIEGLHNKMLLWHGSRTTNFAGILKQGLRIAPPEAPESGYFLGKGIYFVDMIGKSAYYCYSSPGGEGLLLLCEVALGNEQDEIGKKMITELDEGKSSVKGVGKAHPDPKDNVVTKDGVVIPCGEPICPIPQPKNLYLPYNEYVVYDVNQVNIKYLVRVKFTQPKTTG